jgi:hypothetical protein
MKSYLRTVVVVLFAIGITVCIYALSGTPERLLGRDVLRIHTVDGSKVRGIAYWMFEFGDLLVMFVFGVCFSIWIGMMLTRSDRIAKISRYFMVTCTALLFVMSIAWLLSGEYIVGLSIFRIDLGSGITHIEIDPHSMSLSVVFVLCLASAPALACIGLFSSSRHGRLAGPGVRRMA